MRTYHVVATRDGRYWLVHIPELDQYTQARSLTDVEPMARELISLLLEIPADSFQIAVTHQLPQPVRQHLELAKRYADAAAWYQTQAAERRRFAARTMRNAGMTVREIGAALDISHQRAQQLISPATTSSRQIEGAMMSQSYDGHGGHYCPMCRNQLNQRDCDAESLGWYDRAWESIQRDSFGPPPRHR